ncbi:MAG: NADPH:quinone oxidoreductase family protein [Pseudomonadales bacterium]
MRSLVCSSFGPPETLEWVDRDLPAPADDELLIDVSAAGVGFVDGLMIQGLYQVKPPLPYYPGAEFAGVVRGFGSEVSGWQVGQRVMGLGSGAFAEQLSIKAQGVIPLSSSLDDATAAGFYINYATALYGLRDCGALQSGETVLVLGAAGGVGSAAIAVAKAMGARVIAAASSVDKRQAALEFGADACVDYTEPQWRAELGELCAGSLNLVYDPVGGAYSEPAFRSLSPGGRHLVVGFAAGEIPKLPLNLPLLKRASLVGVDWGGEARANPGINQVLLTTLMDWIDQGKLSPATVITRSMSEAAAALTEQLNGSLIGKLVLVNDLGGSAADS